MPRKIYYNRFTEDDKKKACEYMNEYLKTKRVQCPICEVEVIKYQINRHNQTNRHKLKSLKKSENEKSLN